MDCCDEDAEREFDDFKDNRDDYSSAVAAVRRKNPVKNGRAIFGKAAVGKANGNSVEFRVKALHEIEAEWAENIYGKAHEDKAYGKADGDKAYDGKALIGIYDNHGAESIYGVYAPDLMPAADDTYIRSDNFYPKDIYIGMITDEEVEQFQPGDENAVVPPQKSAILGIRAQAQKFVDNAAEAYDKLKQAVDVANDDLDSIRHPRKKISADLMAAIEIHLTDNPGWLLSVLDGKDQSIHDLQQDVEDLIMQRDELLLKLKEQSSNILGLTAGDKIKLETLGVDNLNDLINNYRQLQVQVKRCSERRSEPKLARVDSAASLFSNSTQEWQKEKQPVPPKKIEQPVPPKVIERGGLNSSFTNVGSDGGNARASIPIPMPDKFKGTTRTELERYFRYFDKAGYSRGYPESDKAIVIGNYVPSLQLVHDKLIRKNVDYESIKLGLLNALGADSSAATFTLRTSLDRVKKADDKLYKAVLEEVERQVMQAYNEDEDQGDAELKKILIRLTQEDRNPIFGSTIIPHLNEGYMRLKELVLAVEAALEIKKKNDSQLKQDSKPFASNAGKFYPPYQRRFNLPPKAFAQRDTRSYGNNQRDTDKIVVQSSRTEVQRYPSRQPPLSSPNKINLGNKPVVCYRCNKPGHYASDCTESHSSSVKHIDSLELNGLIPIDNIVQPEVNDIQLFGRKTMLDISLDTVKVNAMIDSGACASVISEAAIGRILRQRPKGVRQITEEDPSSFMSKRLAGADGGVLNIVNCLRIPIAWGNKPAKLAKFFVVSGLTQDVLVGTNVLQDDDHWIEALSYSLKTNKADKLNDEAQSSASINNVNCKVNVEGRTVVPPHTTVFLKVHVPLKGNAILESSTEGLETGFYNSKSGFAYMKYRNTSDILQVFENGEHVASAAHAELVSDIVAPQVESEEAVHIVTDNMERIERLKNLLDLDAPGFSAKGKIRLKQLIEKYHAAFAVSDDEFGRTNVCEHTIDTGDARPIKQPARPVPLPMKHEVKNLVDTLLDQKAIEESSSEWNSPLVLVRKKDGTVRMCVDYRRLNAVTRKDAYPLPNQDALLMSLKGKKIFSALDLVSGYFQIPMATSDKHKTAFSALGKLWQFLVLPQGLTTSPACFSRMMETVFGDLVGKSLFKFLDDILIATETEEEHLEILEEVLKRLIKYNLKLKPKKCEVAKAKLVYLGHVVSAEGVQIGQDKIDKVQNFPVPTSVTQVRQFLGLASYHRKFIEGFAKIASPLIVLTRKNIVFHWGKDEQQSFEALKEKLVRAPILSQPDYEAAIEGSKPFVVWTDACKTGVGAVLTQQDDAGNFHPLFYISKACSEAERNYSITQLEALAVVVAMRKLKTFVMGAKILVRTDHQPLVGLIKKGNLSPQLIRWALELQEYQELTIQFVKGKFNVVADALSRCHGNDDFGEHVEVMESVVLSLENKTSESWFDLLKIDPMYRDLCEKVLELEVVKEGQDEYTVKDGFLLKTDRKSHTVKVVPREKRKLLWEEKHAGIFGGHFGIKKVKNLLKNKYYWVNMGNDVADWTKACMQCFAHKSHRRDRPPLHPFKTDLPMQIVGMDIAEMPISEKGYRYMLVIVDHFTKYASAFPLFSKSAEEVAKVFLEKWCLREQRFPRQVISDMGREFDNKLLSRITSLTSIENIFSLGYNSQFNGLSERFIQTLKKVLAKRVNEAFEWSEVLPFALFAYNTVPHEATGETPHFLLHGFDAFTPSEIDSAERPTRYQTDLEDYKHQVLENLYAAQAFVREKMQIYRKKMALEYNERKNTHPTTINLGDLVFVELPTERVKNALSKLAPRWEGPARVVELGKTHVKVKFLHGESLKEIHLSHVVKWQGKECDAQPLKGETSRRTRVRNGINCINFSDLMPMEKKLSENYGCPEETCLLTVGLILPNSPYSNIVAYSCRDLAEKAAIAMCSKTSPEEKEAMFKKAEDLVARPDKISVSAESIRTTWKAVLAKCPHQAKAFKLSLGKSLDNMEIEDMDIAYEMIAHLNNVQYFAVKNMDTVVVGSENAQRFKNAINANFYHMHSPEESELRAKVIFGSKIKTIVYIPNEKLLYAAGAQFETATRIILQTLNYLDECNNCEIIVLPVLRHLDHPEISQKFINWFKEVAAKDSRLIGNEELDEMKLIHWLHATPSNKDETEHVGSNGLLKELGTQKMVQYLNLLGYKWKHRQLLQAEKHVAPKESIQDKSSIAPKEQIRDEFPLKESNDRG
uniref:RNA-directed DNA polymerase n=2 Tax=Panagrolaimus sp. ES5 TaxID=591445 RepID=A0AC34F952_9BILA